ncbi:MAG: MFS transporter [Elusimicrobiales bacterium]
MNWILFVISLTAFVNPFMISSINIAIIQIEKTFQTTSTLTAWIITSYMLSTALSLIPAGKLAEIHGKRKVFIIGVLIFAISSFLCAFSKNFTFMIISRIIQGLGGGLFLATGTAILTHIFPKEKRGKVLGINVACVYLGLSLGPFLGGIIISKYNWNAIFLITGIINSIIFIISLYKLNFHDEKEKGKIYISQTIFYSFFIVSLIYGISKINSSVGIIFLGISVLSIIVFLLLQNRHKEKLLDIEIFKTNTVFTFSGLSALINYTATTALTFFLNIYLQSVFDFSPQKTGSILLIQPLVMALVSPFAGRLSDKKEPQIIASIGMFLTALSLFMTIFLTEKSTLTAVLSILSTAGLGFGLFSSPNTNAIMSSVLKKQYAMASSVLSTMRVIGQSLSMGITTLILSFYMKNTGLSQNSTMLIKSIKTAFLIFFIMSFVGIFFSMMRGKIHSLRD